MRARIQIPKHEFDLKNGDKVKLNISELESNFKLSKPTDKFRNWVNDNKDTEFTIEIEDGRKESKGMILYCLKEDNTNPKWLFWGGFLTKI